MNEELDPKFEALFKEAKGQEDVYRFKLLMQQVAADYKAKQKPRKRTIGLSGWLSIAASISVLAIAAIWLTRSNSTSNNSALAFAMEKPYLDQTRASGDGAAQTAYAELVVQLQNGNWNAFLEASQEALATPEFADAFGAWTYQQQAFAYLKLDQPDTAKQALEALRLTSERQEAYRYYKAVLALHEGRIEAARSTLDDGRFQYPWSNRAAELLKRLQ